MTDSVQPTARRRFRFRFSLRTFLLALTMLSLWLGYHLRATAVQKHAVEELRKYGGKVYYGYQVADERFDLKKSSPIPAWLRFCLGDDFFHSVQGFNFFDSEAQIRIENPITAEACLQLLLKFPKMTGLYMYGPQASDANLEYVSQMKQLKFLHIRNASNVSDAGVAKLERLRHLSIIRLTNSKITDKSLEVFSRMPNIERLYLEFNRFSDAGVNQLSSLKKLEALEVSGTPEHPNQITDQSLEFLLELPWLSRCTAKNTEVTKEFEDKLKAKFRGCWIKR